MMPNLDFMTLTEKLTSGSTFIHVECEARKVIYDYYVV